ncbi:hypothetical protein ACM16X_04995 [Haloarcula japonica]|uniref:hypothetical protein n=1 Tax=Haloarcula japonica TaxID=29282 RepID=UPI0039F67052
MAGEVQALTGLLPSASAVAGFVLAFLAGAACPTYYAQERLRGFGRALIDRLPYVPPPGMDEQQALEAAAESAEEQTEETP